MNPTAQVPPEKSVETMKDEIEQYAKDVVEAVNKARTARGSLAAKNAFAAPPTPRLKAAKNADHTR